MQYVISILMSWFPIPQGTNVEKCFFKWQGIRKTLFKEKVWVVIKRRNFFLVCLVHVHTYFYTPFYKQQQQSRYLFAAKKKIMQQIVSISINKSRAFPYKNTIFQVRNNGCIVVVEEPHRIQQNKAAFCLYRCGHYITNYGFF